MKTALYILMFTLLPLESHAAELKGYMGFTFGSNVKTVRGKCETFTLQGRDEFSTFYDCTKDKMTTMLGFSTSDHLQVIAYRSSAYGSLLCMGEVSSLGAEFRAEPGKFAWYHEYEQVGIGRQQLTCLALVKDDVIIYLNMAFSSRWSNVKDLIPKRVVS